MIDRVVRRLSFEAMKLFVKPETALKNILDFETVKRQCERHVVELKEDYNRYVQEVSRPDMAISLELAALSHSVFDVKECRKILDLGSGFSSLVSRRYGRSLNTSCWSVDDDPAWLQKTIDYLQRNHLPETHCLLLNDFIQSGERGFDAVLLDLNFVEIRKNFIGLAVDRCRTGGLILFDDVHKPDYLYEVMKQCRSLSVSLYDISRITRDQYGRYALLGVKN